MINICHKTCFDNNFKNKLKREPIVNLKRLKLFDDLFWHLQNLSVISFTVITTTFL